MSTASALVPVGAAGQLRVGYTHANASGTNAAGASVDANDANQFALGYVHNLSKRTALYGTAAYVKNEGRRDLRVVATTPPWWPDRSPPTTNWACATASDRRRMGRITDR